MIEKNVHQLADEIIFSLLEEDRNIRMRKEGFVQRTKAKYIRSEIYDRNRKY